MTEILTSLVLDIRIEDRLTNNIESLKLLVSLAGSFWSNLKNIMS